MSSRPALPVRIVEAVADSTGCDPTTLDPPLQEVIDVDALEAIFPERNEATGNPDAVLRFTYRDREVLVEGTGRVQVTDKRPEASDVAQQSGVSHSD